MWGMVFMDRIFQVNLTEKEVEFVRQLLVEHSCNKLLIVVSKLLDSSGESVVDLGVLDREIVSSLQRKLAASCAASCV